MKRSILPLTFILILLLTSCREHAPSEKTPDPTPTQPVESASPVPVPEISESDIEEPVIPIPTWEHFEYADEPCSIELPEDLLAHAEIYTRSPDGEERSWSVPAEHIDACHQVIKDHLWREIYVQGLPVAYSQNAGVKVIRFAYQVEKIYPDQDHSALRTYETALYCIDGQLCFTMGIYRYLPFYQEAQDTIEASIDALIDLTTPEDPDEIQHSFALEAPECDRWGTCEILRIFPKTDLVIFEGEGWVKSERILAELSCGEITDITDLTSFEAEDSSIIDCYDIPLRGRIDALRSGQTVVHASYDKYTCTFRVEVH